MSRGRSRPKLSVKQMQKELRLAAGYIHLLERLGDAADEVLKRLPREMSPELEKAALALADRMGDVMRYRSNAAPPPTPRQLPSAARRVTASSLAPARVEPE